MHRDQSMHPPCKVGKRSITGYIIGLLMTTVGSTLQFGIQIKGRGARDLSGHKIAHPQMAVVGNANFIVYIRAVVLGPSHPKPILVAIDQHALHA